MGRQFRRTESAPTQPNKLGRVPSTKFKHSKPLVRKRSLKAYLVVLIFSMGCWFRPEDPQLLVQTIAETSSFDELMANLSLTDVLSTEYVLGASYYSLWTKLNEAMSAAVLHFQDAPNVPVYRLLPLLKLQFEYIAKHRMDKHTLKREYAMFGARHTKVEKLDQFADMIGFSEAVYDGELVIRNFLDTTGYELLQYEPAVSYEKPSYFIAYHPLRQHAIVSIKGTSSVSDLLTDVLHTPVPFLRDSWVHSGMLNAARFLVNRTESLIKNIFAPLDYRVTFTGHSLGAGTAQLATLIYRWERNWTGIDCIAVAPPPTLNKQATNYTKDIIWSLVAGDDIFPRWNFGLISANARILADLDAEMQESGKSLDEFYEEFDYLTMTQEYRKTIEEVASSKGAHIDMHVSGEITYVTRTTEGFMVRDVEADFASLRRIEFSTTMISDHTLQFYRNAVTTVAEQLHDPNIHDDGGVIAEEAEAAVAEEEAAERSKSHKTPKLRKSVEKERSEDDVLDESDADSHMDSLRDDDAEKADENFVEDIIGRAKSQADQTD